MENKRFDAINYKDGIMQMIEVLPEAELKSFYFAMRKQIEKAGLPGCETNVDDDHLYGLSTEAKCVIDDWKKQGKVDIYASMCAVIQNYYKRNNTYDGVNEIFETWVEKRNAKQIEKECKEIFIFCKNKLEKRRMGGYYG